MTPKIQELAERNRCSLIYLFGSQAENGRKHLQGAPIAPPPASDLDIAVAFEVIPADPILAYGAIYKDLADLFDPFEVDVVFMHEVDVLFKHEVIRGHRIYETDESLADSFEEQVLKTAEDIAFKKKQFDKDVMEAMTDGYFQLEYEARS